MRSSASGEFIRVNDQYYILAKSSFADDRTRVLKHGETFGVFDRYGDVQPIGFGEQGLYHGGTRFLSRLSILIDRGERPLLLSSTVKDDNVLLVVDLANFDVSRDDEAGIPRDTVHIFRSRFLWQGALHEHLCIRNYGVTDIALPLFVQFEADFRDIFEVRGVKREIRGQMLDPVVKSGSVKLSYEGLDDVKRVLRVTCSPQPKVTEANQVQMDVRLAPKTEACWDMVFSCECEPKTPGKVGWTAALESAAAEMGREVSRFARITTSSKSLNTWIQRSVSDLCMMTSETPYGPYPYAGIPWYSVPFGRDGIITALQCLWINPGLARGVLAYLASTQATRSDAKRDAQPGKIVHEMREGEMAALQEIPFGRYYGSADATPLFVMLAGAYWQRTGDLGFVREIWPAVERALRWLDRFQDGFVNYARETPEGLANQGWRDSGDAVFHANGNLAEAPLSLCEIQGYTFAARRAAAVLALALGKNSYATDQVRLAEALRRRFESAFWLEDLQTYAMALDRRGKPCRVRSSAAGHCLFTGIASHEHARAVASTLMLDSSWSGWGVRTVSALEARYNPMSYHNGSIWPHDNAIVAAGLSKYGRCEEARKIFTGLFDATESFDLRRMPELFCGFHRREGEAPTLYPVACSPQSWAAGAVFMLVESCLGLSVLGTEKRIRFARPSMPVGISEMKIEGLELGETLVDLHLERRDRDVAVRVTRTDGPPIEIVQIPG